MVDGRVRHFADARHQIAHAVPVDAEPEPPLGLDLVALGDRDLAHVVAETGDPPAAQSCRALAARAHAPMRAWTAGSLQWPTTTLRSRRIRAAMNPNSRSPWAAWLRFMKSMSMVDQGIARLNWVCRWRKGFCSAVEPADPHLRGRERVHPRDQSDALGVGIRLEAQRGGSRRVR